VATKVKRIVKKFMAAGFIVPIFLSAANLIELAMNIEEVPVTHSLWPYLWPSSFLLGATHPIYAFDIVDWLTMGISIGVNALLYALIGLTIGSVWVHMSRGGKGQSPFP
jgi:hypothetical protein